MDWRTGSPGLLQNVQATIAFSKSRLIAAITRTSAWMRGALLQNYPIGAEAEVPSPLDGFLFEPKFLALNRICIL